VGLGKAQGFAFKAFALKSVDCKLSQGFAFCAIYK
jgi:hypothetical protein